jgi:LysM repeat protein
MRRRAEFENLRASVYRLEERVSGIEVTMDALNAQVVGLREGVDQQQSELRAGMADLERAQRTQVESIEQVKREIVDELSRKVTKLLDDQPSMNRRPAESGYEHVVQAGETLSEIASAYNVRVSTIVEANKLANPNAIRVGQKLFIPE